MRTTYFIGDIQGCGDQLEQLLALLEQRSKDNFYLFAGDLVNRGPKSLSTLRLIRQLQQSGRADSVLGNHDMHLLAVSEGIRAPHRKDTLNEILQAPDRDELLIWLRQRPLAIWHEQHLLVHAGILPAWSVADAMQYAQEIETMLRSEQWLSFLSDMYGDQPERWDPQLRGHARLRCLLNVFTRMRFCRADGEMEFASKDGQATAPAGFLPWFEHTGASADATRVFGHWSTLGLLNRPELISLDTGCVWGGQLSAVCLQDRSVTQISCPQQQSPT
ncbi:MULTISPECIES: symmetrical bis(5'-nucleosyl)-tetraphosphatase [unclassified Undibacterium]|uniref:symmetrical bis(5'-nucleosyl)-tetraphosphatase n=1 Tax=unclassified Undibacterium TaxID=2630295 RepID=UPI002AC98D3D|nr:MULTISPECIES: symmetrical bis(5'-nucleosyl)-tetraphosphatase [unclassified Undibacterium]MEB0137913.1 symmetrical bis(5'-nucleosyl)-tetraphosphatase [Undibacterium sp. CCC2.1]MEB0172033.1 symmetrical bis(5'-nucleosyl)-tetraphosphatase [Undibacterium sp. CCC1.1]MEB0174921.1 symmetrical bis(5'-nucleosyl)-tetraphosphatase [Undibacterium sp. CCC3.4]MEB0214871.1 symmetrical bis(5'-nucleosyl)-tetraphosphatase [Undibacterium sp. 5I2]WPX45366.1 symmetrical bis(5'-nucleosyl)-tetraphosphatase [Undiba